MTRSEVGGWGETEAANYLRRLGWEILETNWHCRYGEIDLIARLRDRLIFVEVKARRSRSFGLPEEALTPAKRRRILRSAWTFLEERELQGSAWQVDVIAIEGRPGQARFHLDHYRDALADEPDPLP